jgi:RHS repeat-associated protein
LGGIGLGGNVEESVEIFDPSTLKSAVINGTTLKPRAHHTATLLTDGNVLLAGGISPDKETLVEDAEFYDFRSKQKTATNVTLRTARQGHSAALLSDGTVLLWGGTDKFGMSLHYGEVFDPLTNSFRIETTLLQQLADADSLSIKISIPSNQDKDVAIDSQIVVRFSHPIAMKSANTGTVQLSDTGGNVSAKVVPAEGGMLAFVAPENSLNLATTYTLSLMGVQDAQGIALPDSYISFTTVGKKDSTVTQGAVPGAGSVGGSVDSSGQKLPPLTAPVGVTALAGQALRLNGSPLRGVTFRIDQVTAKTDGTGRFLLTNIAPGHHAMVIDGRTVHDSKEKYGVFEDGVDIKSRQTNALDYTVWMTALDTAHAINVAFPTATEVVVTTPTLPGLEFHIPPNTMITDIDGNVASEISITPVPIKQPPFPLPTGVQVPIYFTIQPGGGYIAVSGATESRGGRLIYPNTYNRPSGTRFNFWNYDPDEKGWYVYGQGGVSQDRKSVIPDAGVEIYELTGAMVANPNLAPSKGPCNCSEEGGDPVDMGTGLFVYRSVDLYEPDVIPIALTRTYRQGDGATRDFGMGTQNPYDMFLVGDYSAYSYADLVLPDGSEIHYTRTSPGSSYTNAVYQAQSSGGPFFGSTIVFSGVAWTLTRKDGTAYRFPDATNPLNYQIDGLQSITDRNGNTLTVTRDPRSNISKITSPNGRWIQFTYDTSNRVTLAQDQSGRSVQYFYDTSGRLFKVIDINNGVWLYGYDSNNNLNSITNPRQIAYLQNQYDPSGRVQLQTHADGGTYQFSYITQGSNITETDMTDPNGKVRKVVFNAPQSYPSGFVTGGTPSSITYASGTSLQQIFTYQYQAGTDLLTSTTDPLGRTTSYTFDQVGNVAGITTLAGTQGAGTSYFTYDSIYSQLTSETNPLGSTTQLAYDSKGNLTSLTDPLGNVSRFTPDSQGRPHILMDPLNEATTLSYTGADLTSISDPSSRTTSYSYDSAGRPLTVTSPMSHTTQYMYNAFDQITSVTDSLNGVISFTYDGDRNLLGVTDPKNPLNPTSYAYDLVDRLQTRTDSLGHSEAYAYDENGNLIQFTDRRGKISTYNYDALNRVTFLGYGTQAGPTYESTVAYTYDLGNRPTQVVDSIAGSITRTYDGLNQITQEQTPQGTVSYIYDAISRRTQMTVSGQSNPVAYAYDRNSRLMQISQGATSVLFGYDAANRRTSFTLPNGLVVSYAYDSASEPTGINYQLAGTSLGSLTYSYDSDGRRTQLGGSWARTGLPTAVSTTSYNANNQLTAWGTANLFYDANGNMTSDGTHSYAWDARNHLSQIDGGATATFTYDPFGRRVSKTILAAGTSFLYDGLNAVQELSGTTPTANLLAGYEDEYFQRTDAGGSRNMLTDALGSSVSLSDSSGAVQTSYVYEPYGNTTTTGSASTNTFEYTGRENDNTGLYFYRNRYYAPQLARFISEDPLGFKGGINIYAYVGDSPTNFTDPDGLLTVCCRRVRIPVFRQLGACHCYLILGNGHTLGGYWDPPYLNPHTDRTDDTSPKDKPTCKKIGGCDADNKAQQTFNSMPTDLQIYGPNGTSNTIAQRIINGAGVPYRLDPCAWAAGYSGVLPGRPQIHFPGLPPPIVSREW